MYCHKCGNEIKGNDNFCTKCGQSIVVEKIIKEARNVAQITNNKWWQRLLKVVYIFLWLQILWIVPTVWILNSKDYNPFDSKYRYTHTYGVAFWYSVLAIIIFVVTIRLIKITVLYIAIGQKPEWKKQFKKFF